MKPITATQGWLSVVQAAAYLGISRRSMDKAINIKNRAIGNNTLRLKLVGNMTLISKKSLDAIEHIYTDEKKLR